MVFGLWESVRFADAPIDSGLMAELKDLCGTNMSACNADESRYEQIPRANPFSSKLLTGYMLTNY
jgi:hypothetical protein